MPLYALTIFASAFLLFLLQLITAKQILPWFGGSAAVWATCLVFFQSVLLFGYVYSDWSIRHLAPKRQAIVHVVLLVSSLALLPLIPDPGWKPEGAENPAWRILGLLTVTIGLPYFLLSTTNPLVQAWFARAHPQRSPYRLFALSNLASMLALLGYPLAIETWLTTTMQAKIWAVIYGAFAVLCCVTAWRSLPLTAGRVVPPDELPNELKDEPPPAAGMLLLWAALAAMGSFLLLAVTNHLMQNVVAAPLLWALPLSIYLFTFILCFDGRGWYRRNLFITLLAVLLCVMVWVLNDYRLTYVLVLQIGLFSAGLFVACMFCHGELDRLRPAPRYLTRFYLMVALGGAIGALLVGIVAPLVLPCAYEFDIGLALLAGLVWYQVRDRRPLIRWVSAGIVLFTTAGAIYQAITLGEDALMSRRNFYGVVRVIKLPGQEDALRWRGLAHGTILHGEQFQWEGWRRTPISYYGYNSGVGRTLQVLQQPNARVGAIGLGVGTIAAYGKPGDTYRFYEINPAVIQIARQEFTYLNDSAANIEIVPGDARLNLEREPDQQFHVLVVDAFSGDAIPMHLITREALGLYLRHLHPSGVIAFHVSNRFIDLLPVVKRLADDHGLKAAYIHEADERKRNVSKWVLLTREQMFLDVPNIREAALSIPAHPEWRPWTDDFNNLFQVLSFRN